MACLGRGRSEAPESSVRSGSGSVGILGAAAVKNSPSTSEKREGGVQLCIEDQAAGQPGERLKLRGEAAVDATPESLTPNPLPFLRPRVRHLPRPPDRTSRYRHNPGTRIPISTVALQPYYHQVIAPLPQAQALVKLVATSASAIYKWVFGCRVWSVQTRFKAALLILDTINTGQWGERQLSAMEGGPGLRFEDACARKAGKGDGAGGRWDSRARGERYGRGRFLNSFRGRSWRLREGFGDGDEEGDLGASCCGI